MNSPFRLVIFLSFLVFPTLGAAAQTYWDEIELIDGQVLRGVVIDTVKDIKVIQLSTRDFISLPASSVVRTVTAQQRRKEAEAKIALPPVKIDLGLAVVTPGSPGWKASWGTVRYQSSQAMGIELEDGQVFEGNWLDTTRGQAVLLRGDGTVLSLDRSSIRRVTAVQASRPEPVAGPVPSVVATTVEPEPQPDILTPFFVGVSQSLEAVFAGPPGADPALFRAFFIPTARLAVPGKLNVHQLDGAATQLTLGFTDYLQVQASSLLPTLASPDLPSFWQAGAQVSFPLWSGGATGVSSWVSLGQWAGGLRTNKTWSDPTFLPFVNLTGRQETGSSAFEATVMAGFLVNPSPQRSQAVLGASARLDPTPGFAVVTELVSSLSLEEKVDGRTSGVVGIRLWHENLALDLGVQGVRQSLWENQGAGYSYWGGWSVEKVRKDTLAVYPVANLSLRF